MSYLATVGRTSAADTAAAPHGESKLSISASGMVTSPHQLATQAGLDVLTAGGNAIEAAITSAASLNVTYPHFSGFGGDAFMIISDRAGNVRTLSGIGQAPGQLPEQGGPIPLRGPGSMLTTAANVDTLGKAFELSRAEFEGKKSWSELLTPAIRFACEGFPVTPSQRFWTDFRQNKIASMPALSGNFMTRGQAPEVGHLFRQRQLADTLETLAVKGHRDFYEGTLAVRIAKGLQEAGSPLTASDLAKTRARLEAPLQLAYRDGVLLAHQPPTQGITTLEIMGVLNRFDFTQVAADSADYYHLLVEAVKQAFIDRDRYVADPEFHDVPSRMLLSEHNLDRLAARIELPQALAWPHLLNTGDTVFIATTDAAGNAVSMLQTIYFDWGSGVMVGDTGILWHNRGAAFSMDPDHANCLQPGKRPFHTLNPGMYLKNGKPHMLYGTQGADGQPQTVAAVLTRLIDYQMDPLTALSKPRFLLGRTFSNSLDSLKLESDAGEEVFQELARRGHETSPIGRQSALAGHAGVIVIDSVSGAFSGAHDPRSDGKALGL